MTEGTNEGNVTEKAVPDIEEKRDEKAEEIIETTESTEASITAETTQPVETTQAVEPIVVNIEETVEAPKPPRKQLPKYAFICLGEYPAKVLLKSQFPSKEEDVQPVFIDKSSEELTKWSKTPLDKDIVSGLDANIETRFWYQVLPFVSTNENLTARLKNMLLDNQHGAFIVATSWDGIGSAMLPTLITRFKEWNVNSVALALLPSKLQPSDAHFNAFSSMGMCAAKETATIVLVGRDQLNKYVGVNRNGSVMKGNMLLNCLIEMTMAKKTFVGELSELSRSFGVKMFTVLAATGASLKIYGSLENILDTTLFRSLLPFDLSGASLIYVLFRIPVHLREKLNRDKIELTIANWFKEKATLKSIHVTEPLYVEEVNDRVDMLLFVGGFDLKEMFTQMENKVSAVKTQAVKQGLIKEEEWKEILRGLQQ